MAEAREMGAVNQRLSQQVERVAALRTEIEANNADTEALATRVLASGLSKVRGQFEEEILSADKVNCEAGGELAIDPTRVRGIEVIEGKSEEQIHFGKGIS